MAIKPAMPSPKQQDMGTKRKYHVQVRSTFAQLWRYNIYMLCGESNAEGESLHVIPVQSKAASVGDNLREAPAGFDGSRELEATIDVEQTLEVYVYIVPHTLPTNSEPEQTKPFKMRIKITADGEEVYNTVHMINQWSGDSIALKFPNEK